MSAEDSHSYNAQQHWTSLQQQPPYGYPHRQDEPQLVPSAPSTLSHERPPDPGSSSSYNYAPTYNQISQSSSLIPPQNQFPQVNAPQVQYTSYPQANYPGHQQSQQGYLQGAQHTFDQTIPEYHSSSTASNTYVHPLSRTIPQLDSTHEYAGQTSPPIVTSPDDLASAFPLSDGAYSHDLHRMGSNKNKRQRSEEQDEDDGEGNVQGRSDSAQGASADKLKRACTRCRGLKVRCHFRDDNDTCDRCIKASRECIIPGRKQRRPPPKREVLLTKIRDQAAQIDKLMAQLETVQMADRKLNQMTTELPIEFARSSTLESPASRSHTEYLAQSMEASNAETASSSSVVDAKVSQENSEWMAKARETFEAFGGFIRLGGSSTTKKDLVDQDLEDSSSNDDGYAVVVNDGSESEEEYDPGQLSPDRVGSLRDRGSSKRGSPSTRTKMVGLPPQASPFGMMAALSVGRAKSRRSPSVASDASDLGVANEDFFRPPDPDSPKLGIPGYQAPLLLRKNIITSAEAEKLFKIYFDWMNISVSLLDPKLYTAQQVYWRSPFLFTVICAIASRYDTERPDLYPTAMEYARQAAGATFLGGEKRVEVVQAYILLSLWPIPARRWEDDRCWIYLGQAIRMAVDMNLHHPNTAKPRNELHAREMLNRTRAWLNCFNLDRSMGSQYGKTPIINNADYVANHSPEWWNSSEYNMEHFDIHLCAYNAELRILSSFLMTVYSDPQHPTGLNKEIDLERLATKTDDEIEATRLQWFRKLEQTDTSDVQNRFRMGLLRLGYSYARLVALSFGFQHAFGKSNADENPFVNRCIRAASDVVSAMVDDIGRPSQRTYVRHGPDAQTVFVSFSCTFLIKLLQPKYASYISPAQRAEIVRTVERAVEFHGSPDIGIDERHGPRLYSRFIGSLLEHVKTPPPAKLRSSRSKRPSPDPPAASANTDASLAPPPIQTQANPINYFDPLPPRFSTPFDHFGMPTENDQAAVASGGSALGLMASDFFYAPLPLDNDLLQSMQSLSSLPDMQGSMVPGFGWMQQMPPVDFSYQQQQQQQMSSLQYSLR